MELILAHHEMFMLVLQYGLTLILGGWICFKHLFPLLGRWIVDLCKKLEDANKRMEQEREKVLGQQAQRRKDDKCVIDGLYMDQSEIESAYSGRWIQEEQPEEPGTEEYRRRK